MTEDTRRLSAYKELIDFTFSKLTQEDRTKFSIYLDKYLYQVYKDYTTRATSLASEFHKFIEGTLKEKE